MKVRTGDLTTGALFISALSGFVVAYQYEVATPFVSSVAIEAVLSYGAFWRSLHFWSSQSFFLLLVYHLVENLVWLDRAGDNLGKRRHWTVIAITLFLGLFALFTGYVLRYDGTGVAACTIAEHLLLTVPLVGSALDRFLMATSYEGLNRVYALHILLTVLLWGLGTWYHTKRVLLSQKALLITLVPLCLFCMLVRAPIDLPGQNVALIKGPWFFLGVQELLRYMPPFFAGIIYPIIPLVALCLLPWLPKAKHGLWVICAWCLSYGYLTFVACLR